MSHRLAILLLVCMLISPALAESRERDELVLQLADGPFHPGQTRSRAPAWYMDDGVDSSPTGKRYRVAITRQALDASQRRFLEAAGAEILDYIPTRGYRLRLAPGAEAAVAALPFVAWVGPLPAHRKIESGLSGDAEQAGGESKLRAVLSAGEPPDRVLARLAGLQVRAHPSGRDRAWRVEARVPADRMTEILSRLASLPEVEAVEPVRNLRMLNQDAVWVHQSFVGPAPQETPIFDRGIFGCGQTVAVSDSGQDHDICYFLDSVTGPPPVYSCLDAPCPAGTIDPAQRKDVIYYNWSGTPTGDDDTCPGTSGASGHGTHTSGSIAGDAPAYADCATYSDPGRSGGDGQAPGAKLVIQELGDGLEYLVSGGGTIWNLADVAYQSGARIHSLSWGGVCHNLLGICIPGCALPYDSLARDVDLAMWTYPDLLMVLSAGNAGGLCPPPNSVNTPAIAKSALSVGALGHGANADNVSSFSSRGPIFDGRLKPTLAAQGEATVSAASDADLGSSNCGTCSLDGSSMSAPIVAGLAALAREYYTAGFYAAGERDPGQGFVPSGALLKATLIDGAYALGTNAPQPDFLAGYGRVLLGSTLAFGDSGFQLRVDDHGQGIGTGSVVAHAYDVTEGTPLRVTLVWTDYPAALNAAVARVNELKLEVIDPQGNAWFQTRDDFTGGPKQTMDPGDPHDTRNVEERLVFDAPAAGRWVVRVHGVDVPWGPQPFALVVRGDLADCLSPAAPAAPALATPADGQVHVSWAAVPGAAAYNVYRSFGSCPAGPWVPVATALSGTSFLDTDVSGGTPYSYRVTASSDLEGFCESDSSCASVTPSGDCLLPPEFRGITQAVSTGEASCTVSLAWDAARPYCGAEVRYNVYRDTTSGFLPAPANRIARCVAETHFTDAADLTHGQTYHYVVRAEDGTSGHGGPCFDGTEETNLAEAAASPFGPEELGVWLDDAGDTGVAKFSLFPPWTLDSTGGVTGSPNVYRSTSSAFVCADLTTPVLTLGGPGTGPQISFATIHDLEYDPVGILGAAGSLGQVEIANGPDFTDWTRVELSPDYPAGMQFPVNECPSTAALDTYFSGTDLEYSTYTGSLVNWGGGEVQIRFHLSGDYLYPGGNWWIDDVAITQAMVPGSCAGTPAGPPPVPDGGSVAGAPLRVAKNGTDLLLTWDGAQCPATAVNVYRGTIGDYASFTAGDCDLPATGSATLPIPDDAWFLVVATDGATTDGSWSRDAAGNELSYASSGAACPAIAQHDTNNGCP